MLETPELDFGVDDAEIEALTKETEGPSEILDTPAVENVEVPVETKQAAPVAIAPKTPVVPEAKVDQHFEFTVNGRQVKAPLSQIIKWAQQGHDYPQRMAELNKQRESILAMEKSYKPIDEWVRNNQDKWEKLQAVIKAEQQGVGSELPPHILQTLQKYDQKFQELEQEKQAAKHKQEDSQLDQEIQSIREKYKDLDWATADIYGRSAMEVKVLEHASQNKFRNFKTAFLDLYHDDLLKAAETRGKEQLAATKERQAKTGLLPVKSAAPELKRPQSKGKHYQSTHEILEELGLK